MNLSKSYEILKILDKLSIIHLEEHYQIYAKVQVVIPHQNLFDFLRRNQSFHQIMTLILRNHSGIFDFMTKINLDYIRKMSGISEKQIIQKLIELEKREIISLKLMQHDLSFKMLQAREDNRAINRHAKYIKAYRQQKINQVEAVIGYIQNSDTCYQNQILQYFGEKPSETCGICSVCKNKQGSSNKTSETFVKNEILSLLEHSPLSSSNIISKLNFDKTEILRIIASLLDQRIIKLTSNNLYHKV